MCFCFRFGFKIDVLSGGKNMRPKWRQQRGNKKFWTTRQMKIVTLFRIMKKNIWSKTNKTCSEIQWALVNIHKTPCVVHNKRIELVKCFVAL